MSEQQVPTVIYAAQKLIVDGVRARLLGLLVNADDALFELAARCSQDVDRKRCFDLARLLRQQRSELIEHFCRAMNRADRLWARRDFRIHAADPSWLDARLLSTHVRTHFSPLLSAVAANVGRLLEVEVDDPDALPFSPTCVGAAYLESRSMVSDICPEAAPYLDGLFVRYVVDRLGSIYGDALTLLTSGDDALPSAIPERR